MHHARRLAVILTGSALVVTSLAAAVTAAPSTGSHKPKIVTVKGRPLNGFFSSSQKDLKKYHSADVELTVSKQGKRVGWPGGAGCMPNATAVSKGIPNFVPTTIYFPKHDTVPIAANGKFSYSKTITLTPYETQSDTSYTVHVTITGRFVRHQKLTEDQTTAVTGHFSAPDLCASTTPTTFTDYYAGKDV